MNSSGSEPDAAWFCSWRSCGKSQRTKAFDAVWIRVSYKLTIPNFPTYLVNSISKYHIYGCFGRTSTHPQPCARRRRAGLAEVGLVSHVFFCLTWRTPPCHPMYDKAFILTPCHQRRTSIVGLKDRPQSWPEHRPSHSSRALSMTSGPSAKPKKTYGQAQSQL